LPVVEQDGNLRTKPGIEALLNRNGAADHLNITIASGRFGLDDGAFDATGHKGEFQRLGFPRVSFRDSVG
jgi:hypothetical protein